MRRLNFKWTAAFLVWFGATAAIVATNIYSSVPSPTALKDCLVTKMYEVELCPKKASYVPLSQISSYLKDAVLVSEDTGFYHHNGFELEELKESLKTNLARASFARGGSTITQQLARNLFLTPEKSILRKVKEAIITYQLEKHLSKNEIFERYLNVVEFGENIYGIKAAALHYFGKSPRDLSVLESAYLAFLLPSPKKYSASFRKGTLSKFGYSRIYSILYRLVSYQKISPEEYEASKVSIKYFPWTEGSLAHIPTADDLEDVLEPGEEAPFDEIPQEELPKEELGSSETAPDEI
jgi:monofunctional glycosyltransferase